MRSLNENKALLQSKFLTGLKQFKSLLRSTLVPKHSYTDGEFVTGEGGDFLTESYNITCISLMRKLSFETFVEKQVDCSQTSVTTTYFPSTRRHGRETETLFCSGYVCPKVSTERVVGGEWERRGETLVTMGNKQ